MSRQLIYCSAGINSAENIVINLIWYMKQSWQDKLKSIAGQNNFFDSERYRLVYSYDSQDITGIPGAIVFGRNERQIRQILKFCNENKVSVFPRGSGSGMTGGAVAGCRKSIVLNLARMHKVLEFMPENLLVKVQMGIINKELNIFLEERGFVYPPDPASAKFSTIGGNVAENAGGPSAVKYGVTSNYVINIRVALADGSVIETNRDLLKSVSGYNLTGLFVGSEGTLGIFTEITLKILPLLHNHKTLLIGFDSYSAAAKFIPELYSAGLLPTKLEFMDKKSLFVTSATKKLNITMEITALLIIEFDAPSAGGIVSQIEKIESILEISAHEFVYFPEKKEDVERIWEVRKAISPSLYKFRPIKINEDIVVPVSELTQLFKVFERIEKKYSVEIISFGHIGDGNIHTNIMMDKSSAALKDAVLLDLFSSVVGIGGSISGEHGIGITKIKYLKIEKSSELRQIYRKLKNVFDPNNILNPGKAI